MKLITEDTPPIDEQLKYRPKVDAVIIRLDDRGEWMVSVECVNKGNHWKLFDMAMRVLGTFIAEQEG